MRNKFLLLFFIVVSSCANTIFAQDAQFSHTPFLSAVYNPSFAGSHSQIAAGGSFRSQWTLFNGQPFSQSLYVHLPYEKLKGGLGLSLVNDFAAAHRSTNLQVQYAYRKKLSIGYLNAGIQAGLMQFSLYGDKLRAADGNYDNGEFLHNDPSLPTGLINAIAPDLGIGGSLITEHFTGGIAVQHLLPVSLKYSTGNGSGIIKYPPTTYLQLQYNKTLNENWQLMPSIFYKTDLTKGNLDVLILAAYKKQITGGIGFRGFSGNTADAVILLVGYQIKPELFVVYSYDLTISTLHHTSIGSNEIGLHYRMIPPPPPPRGKIIYSPRFL